jgi:hypothetical protein
VTSCSNSYFSMLKGGCHARTKAKLTPAICPADSSTTFVADETARLPDCVARIFWLNAALWMCCESRGSRKRRR